MPVTERHVGYDPFAWFFNEYWTREIAPQILSALDQIFVPHLPPQAHLLDLCCGTGQIAAALTHRGFTVTGLDASQEMLRYARRNAPAASFIHADARSFTSQSIYDGVLSTFDSLNHLMSLDDLTEVFHRVHQALAPHGLFIFDMNMEKGFLAHWEDHYAIVEDDHVCVLKGEYNREEKIGRYDITMFRQQGDTWQRTDAIITERCYAAKEIKQALRQAGFQNISTYDAQKDVGLVDHIGRSFFLVHKDV